MNPVLDGDFPDPFILHADDGYWAYATTDATSNIQVAHSTDLVHWQRADDALPDLPLWQPSSRGYTWAPEVYRIGGRYVMYYTARFAEAGKQCISTAEADRPQGPFVDKRGKPLLCQLELGGSIDATRFVDQDGASYLVWKNDGNCCGMPTELWAQPLSEDGLTLTGRATKLGLRNDEPWEGSVIEAPTLLLHDGIYYLFFSANDYASIDYAVGYATSKKVLGPYTDAPENPILATGKSNAIGPGHQAIIQGPQGQLWMAYHAWHPDAVGPSVGGVRSMWLDKVTFENGKPIVHGPTESPQAVP